MITLHHYINEALPSKPFVKYERVLFEKAILFVHNYPGITKTVQIAGLILGSFIFFTSFSLLPIASFKAIILLSIGSSLCIISYLALKLLKIIAPPRIDKHYHSYRCQKTEDAELFYKGDIPVLNIKTKDAYKAGFVHGYFLGDQINTLRNIWSLAIQKLPSFLFIHTSPKTTQIPKLIEKIKEKIPQKYLIEIEGLVNGFNTWAKEKCVFLRPRKLTIDDVILFHLEPDIRHLNHLEVEKNLSSSQESLGLACSAIVDKDPIEGNVFAASTDWPTFGTGNLALMIIRENKIKQAEIGLPGFIGTLCGMNENGFSLRMNICDGKTQDVQGMPNAFLTRLCLEQCKKVKDVQNIIKNNPSLGPFHLTAVDEKNAQAFFIKQGENESGRIRSFSSKKPLVITNFRYDRDDKPTNSVNCSAEREERIYALFEDAKKTIASKEYRSTPILKNALRLPFVNNLLTAHSMILHPKKRTIEVAFDNAYASKNKHQMLFNLF